MTDLHAEEVFALTGPAVAANLAADPLADRFEVETYATGECDVNTRDGRVTVHTYNGEPEVRVFLMARREQSLEMTRGDAINLRDALDVLIRNTQQNTGE